MRGHTPSRARGFTLIELLVAISLMALMAVLSWRGLDGISRAQTSLQQRADDVLALQATLAQWGADLDAMRSQPDLPGLDWDGRALRILRNAPGGRQDGLQVVAWARHAGGAQDAAQGHWFRWQSPPLTSRLEVDLAWQKAAVWAQNPGTEERVREVRTVALDQWQIFYYRNNAWTNPLSSADQAPAPEDTGNPQPAGPTQAAVPDGVRVVLTLASGQAITGLLTRDWARPSMDGGP